MTLSGNGRGRTGREPGRETERVSRQRDSASREDKAAQARSEASRLSREAAGKRPTGPENVGSQRAPSRRSGAAGRGNRVPSPDELARQSPPRSGSEAVKASGPGRARDATPKRSAAAERVLARRASKKAAATADRASLARSPTRAVVRRSEGRLVQPRIQAQAWPEVDGAPVDQRRRASAGRIIGVGLLCFLIWLLFDANQLYHSAQAGQIGARRTVAVIILRPIAAVSDALHLSGPVNGADSALGRCGIGGAPACASTGTLPTIPVTVTTIPIPPPTTVPPRRLSPVEVGYMGFLGAPHISSGLLYPPPLPAWPPPILSPTPSHPLTLLSIGDSIGEDLGFGLDDVFSLDTAVKVVQVGVESTGLARPDYYNWPATLATDLHRYRPKIVVVMMGANDAQALYDNGNWISFDTPQWWQIYRSRVALVMDEAIAAGAHVMWVGLPPMGPGSSVPPAFPHELNKIFRAEAASHYGVRYFSAAAVLSNPKGGFTQYKSIRGSFEEIRSADGVHLLPAGYDLLAKDLIVPMEQAWHVDLDLS